MASGFSTSLQLESHVVAVNCDYLSLRLLLIVFFLIKLDLSRWYIIFVVFLEQEEPQMQGILQVQLGGIYNTIRIEIYVVALARNPGIKEVTEWMFKLSGAAVTELLPTPVFARYNQDATTPRSVSVSSAAVELALLKQDQQYSLSSTAPGRLLIVGAGKMGKLVIRHLVAKGCKKMVVVNRTEDRVTSIREELTGVVDIIYKPFQKCACVYNVDHLKEVVEANKEDRLKKKMEAEAIIADEVKQFEALKDSLETVPTIKKLRAYAERIRAAEVDKCLSKMDDDHLSNKKAIYDLSIGIVNKLLHGPMQHLKCDNGTQNRTLTDILENMHALDRIFGLDTETISVLEEDKLPAKIQQNQNQFS
ncbi:hypothetical protein HAX54_046426 [Datura stramonium]|uniref:Glutamyl-tRNA reductase n=1 Tax=Datura stramonium TaxID=4076 RepID=A0ABS8WJG3_DATST|nr:hypothetical protein [Datura stramonium]